MNKDFEIRSSELSAENEKLIGYVVKWNSPSELMWGEFVEQFAQGAFSETLSSGADVRALFEHDHTKLLGRTQANTLKLEEDSIGLRFELTPPETSLGKDLLVSVKRGDITGMSFGFRAKAENWNFELTPCQRITYIFIGILRTDLSNQLHKLRIPAKSELQARKKLARDYVLVFAGKIPLKTHRTFTHDALEVDHA